MKKFLEYTGPVTYKTIDQLLKEVKKTEEFRTLHKTTARRVYAILVEILENIAKHSITVSFGDSPYQPSISAEMKNEKIVIHAENPISQKQRDMLLSQLELVNDLDEEDLAFFYEDKINRKAKKYENGAGLGFILVRLKSGNKIEYTFTEKTKNALFIVMQIIVNKYVMRKLSVDRTASSPKVLLDPENNTFEISGESRPSDVAAFYYEILSWFDNYSQYLLKSPHSGDIPVFNLDFEYFNSSSAKYILDFCKLIAATRSKGREINLKWHYESDDMDMLEAGREMSRISKLPFEFVQKDIK
jgi:hypothetical protein